MVPLFCFLDAPSGTGPSLISVTGVEGGGGGRCLGHAGLHWVPGRIAGQHPSPAQGNDWNISGAVARWQVGFPVLFCRSRVCPGMKVAGRENVTWWEMGLWRPEACVLGIGRLQGGHGEGEMPHRQAVLPASCTHPHPTANCFALQRCGDVPVIVLLKSFAARSSFNL